MKDSFQKGFSRYERNGIIFLCLLLIISIVAEKYVMQFFRSADKLTEADQLRISRIQQQMNEAKTKKSYSYTNENNAAGVRKFFPEDTAFSKKKYDYNFKIEVNSASAEEYEKLYGIGKVLSQRIVAFRDKLGGFYAINQIKDVWGIQDSVFQKFKKNLIIRPVKIKKININTATYEELTASPYFFSTLAKQIIGYRSRVKPFASVEDIKNLYYIRDHPEAYDKIAVYISLN